MSEVTRYCYDGNFYGLFDMKIDRYALSSHETNYVQKPPYLMLGDQFPTCLKPGTATEKVSVISAVVEMGVSP